MQFMGEIQTTTVCTVTRGEETALIPQVGAMAALTISQDSVVAEMQKTIQVFEQFQGDSQTKNSALVRINETLYGQFIALEGRLRENEELYQRNLNVIAQERGALRQEVTLLRQNMAAVTAQAEQCVAAETAAKAEAVRTAILAGEEQTRVARAEAEAALRQVALLRAEAVARDAAAHAEKNAAVQAATQASAAQLALRLQQAEDVRQAEARQAQEYREAMELQMEDTFKMQNCCFEIKCDETVREQVDNPWMKSHPCTMCGSICIPCRDFATRFKELEELVVTRRGRRINFATHAEQERSDTQKLQQVAAAMLSVADHHYPSSWSVFAQQREAFLRPRVALLSLILRRTRR
jgi:hypothetical protein